MTVFQAVIYGIVQGLGEFLPISSSGHLKAVPLLFGWSNPDGLAFDVALHLGTLIAVILFFWKDWIRLTLAGLKGTKSTDGKLFWLLVLATVPGAAIGMLLENQAETTFNNLLLIGSAMFLMGIVLYIADKNKKEDVNIDNIGLSRGLMIGLSQAVAIIPGVSRSGITMSTARFLGLDRESAARFSFLLSTPIIVGAGILKVKEILHPQMGMHLMLIGIVTSAIIGLLSIKFLLDYLKSKGFGIFVWYRLIVGSILIAAYFIK